MQLTLSRPGRTRTRDKGIMSPQATTKNTEENEVSGKGAAQGAAVELQNSVLDPDLNLIIRQWPRLSESIKSAIRTLAETAEK